MTTTSFSDRGSAFVSRGSERRGGFPVVLAGAISVFLLLLAVFWVGYIGSDDDLYWGGSSGWLAHIPYVGNSHWTLRHTLVIPLALARLAFGDGMLAMALPTVLYAIGVITVVALWTNRAAGLAAAATVAALVATNPQLVLLASSADVDIVEAFFVLLGFMLVHAAMTRGEGSGRSLVLLAAGFSIGLAMLSRETTVLAVVAIVLLFLAGYGMRRVYYFVIGAGFCIPFGLELIYLWWLTGNPFYRAIISLHHKDGYIIDRTIEQGSGIPVVHPAIDPFIMLLLSHDFPLLFWACVPLTVWLFRRGGLGPAARRLSVLATTLALTWTVLAAELWMILVLAPRYYLLPSIAAATLTGVALAQLWQRGRPRLSLTIGALLVVANIAALSVDNRNYLYGEHVLADVAARQSGPIHTDGQTQRRAHLLLDWRGVADRVVTTPPRSGELVFDNPAWSDAQKPQTDWIVVERHGLPETLGQRVAKLLLPASMLTPAVWNKLGPGHPDVTLYRVP